MIAVASLRVSVVAVLNNLVLGPNLLTIPLLTMRRFFPKLSASCSVFFSSESERFDTTIKENVPKKTPRTARAVLSLKLTSDLREFIQFKYILFIPVWPHWG